MKPIASQTLNLCRLQPGRRQEKQSFRSLLFWQPLEARFRPLALVTVILVLSRFFGPIELLHRLNKERSLHLVIKSLRSL